MFARLMSLAMECLLLEDWINGQELGAFFVTRNMLLDIVVNLSVRMCGCWVVITSSSKFGQHH